ncbi:MAG: LysE family transporter [Rhizobiales bacterium]|nr:LysE family transporter [Hyphomicrobiales bacterium]
MDLTLIVASLAMGLAVAAPFGPVNIMVIRATLRRGLTGGLVAGAGALTADGSFAAVAAYGLSTVEHFFIAHATVLTLAGGALLVGFGIITARAHFSAADLTTPPESPSATQLWRKAAATFSATVTNPPALFGNLVVFGTMAGVLRLGAAPWRPAVAVAGFAVGGSLWWIVLTIVVHHLKYRLNPAVLDRISRWTGVVIAGFGFALLMQAAG